MKTENEKIKKENDQMKEKLAKLETKIDDIVNKEKVKFT